MKLGLQRYCRVLVGAFVTIALSLCVATLAVGQEALCAKVKVEILQKLTFERQGFEARMYITNSLDSVSLTNVTITLHFLDDAGNPVTATTDPNSSTALFFLRQSSLTGVSNVTGSGVINASSAAEAKWLIIPARGAAGSSLSGKRYFIGAHLSYRVGGDLQEVDVVPDYVTVSPMPDLQLDYFLTEEIHADDPRTTRLEPSEPFTLGVRVRNQGSGVAHNVSIDSAQPRIVENELGLLIGFQILKSFVGNDVAQPTLLINFGDVPSNSSRVGRWTMETNLSGRFVDFSARFTHGDDLGGKLTSLISQANTHFLIHDVIVDLPGRDKILDFLGRNDGDARVYESDSVDSPVNNYSAIAVLSGGIDSGGTKTYYLDVPSTAGMFFAEVPDPELGEGEIIQAVRSDGKILQPENTWFTSYGYGPDRKYLFGLFDINGGGRYRIKVGRISDRPSPPVLQFIPDRTRIEGQRVSFIIQGDDPNDTIPTLTLDAKPVGATFVDRGDGVGIFDWPTTIGQAGRYPLTFRASDGEFSTPRTAYLTLLGFLDTDRDGLDDNWERTHFGSLVRDGNADFDLDGLSDKQEQDDGTDPKDPLNAPSVPMILEPLNGSSVQNLTPSFLVSNSNSGQVTPTYDFEVYRDVSYTNRVASGLSIVQGPSTTGWTIGAPLNDNTKYYWRTRAKTGIASSEWAYGAFLVDLLNEAPSAPIVSAPADGTVVPFLRPTLALSNSVDPEGESVRYAFEVATAPSSASDVQYLDDISQGIGVTAISLSSSLIEDGHYYWRGIATDARGRSAASPWSTFTVNTTNNPPSAVSVLSPAANSTLGSSSVELHSTLSVDPEGLPVSYFFEVDTTPAFNSGATIVSGPLAAVGSDVRFQLNGLSENVRYYWRVKASDGAVESSWTTASFFVNQVNEAPSVPTINNPAEGAFVEVVSPLLVANPAVDPDGDTLQYRFELYGDSTATVLIATELSSSTDLRVSQTLENNTRYYFRVRAEDPFGLQSGWSTLSSFFVNTDGINDSPVFSFISPTGSVTVKEGDTLQVIWADLDPDSDATITLRLNGFPISPVLSEDLEGEGDVYRYVVKGFAPGVYTLFADVSDGVNSFTVSGAAVQIQPAGPDPSDLDGDGVPNVTDNCPYVSNLNQKDSGTVGSKKKDGIGDACQCGDVSGDGRVDGSDVKLLTEFLKPKSKKKLKQPQLCDVASSTKCDKSDLKTITSNVNAAVAASKKKKVLSIKTITKMQRCNPAVLTKH